MRREPSPPLPLRRERGDGALHPLPHAGTHPLREKTERDECLPFSP